jgi:hypothetical protein
MPADSKADLILSSVEDRLGGTSSLLSSFLIVRAATPDLSASSAIVHLNAPLAARI